MGEFTLFLTVPGHQQFFIKIEIVIVSYFCCPSEIVKKEQSEKNTQFSAK